MPTSAVREDLRASGYSLTRQLLPAFVASRLPLTDAQWALIPVTHAHGLARALPAALACSFDQARQVVRRLPPLTVKRLRTAAVCLARVQRHMGQNAELWPQYLPPEVVQHILWFVA